MERYSELNENSRDLLKELGNIGTGNAITSLSAMLGRTFQMELPRVRIVKYQDTPELLGGAERLQVGTLLEVRGGLTGIFMFLMDEEFTRNVLNALMGEAERNTLEMDEMSRSAVCEIGNIMCASYINALGGLTNLKIGVSAPDMCIDMVGAILSVPMIHFANISDELMLIENKFSMEGMDFLSHVLFLPEIESLEMILKILGA